MTRPALTPRLLAALTVLFLLAFAVPAAGGSVGTDAGRGDQLTIALTHVGTTVGVATERLRNSQHRVTAERLLPAAYGATVMLAFAFTLLIARRSLAGSSRQAYLLSSAGPGPPRHS
jgi:hypothetical protein